MPIWSDFRIIQAQASIFTPDLNFATTRILTHFLSRWEAFAPGEPKIQLIPEVPGAPAELPRLILQSQDMQFRIQVALARLDLFWVHPMGSQTFDRSEYLGLVENTFRDYIQFTSARVGRLAYVLVRAAPAENPGYTLSRHFCDPKWLIDSGPLNRPSGFELHAHKRFPIHGQVGDYQVNSWVRCKTGLVQRGVGNEGVVGTQAIIVEQDFNTLAEEMASTSYSMESIADFFRTVPDEFDLVLRRYFPEV